MLVQHRIANFHRISYFHVYVAGASLCIYYPAVPSSISSCLYLARSAKLPTGLYILLALISSFFKLQQSYLRIYWTDFHEIPCIIRLLRVFRQTRTGFRVILPV